jgi:hypothetical protein
VAKYKYAANIMHPASLVSGAGHTAIIEREISRFRARITIEILYLTFFNFRLDKTYFVLKYSNRMSLNGPECHVTPNADGPRDVLRVSNKQRGLTQRRICVG